ncbi:hypothetical protein Dhaf_4156 [Desulfitobacterium hafniense DCB-2]|uniref:Uncharacterized protein n=1 Tax=Desulfitobacterium hafniense (strain DSM 10664 / DCB-2) TaxID=272564 RepID=B8FTS2_DESHD|nr:hypothetical protein Dhaf_4156 [Desulfitobacterium hafniense DCB-2]
MKVLYKQDTFMSKIEFVSEENVVMFYLHLN